MPVRWIFFDLGSTLVDESRCYQRRYEQIAERAGVPCAAVESMAEALFAQNKKGDALTAAHFGVPLPVWPTEEEKLYPRATQVLKELRRCGYHLGVIANQLPGTGARLEAWGIHGCFEVVIASAEAGVAKPDAAIFRRALSEAGCAAEEAVMVGDRIDNDIAPAKALGMQTVWIRQGPRRNCLPHTDSERAAWTVETLDGLLEIWKDDGGEQG